MRSANALNIFSCFVRLSSQSGSASACQCYHHRTYLYFTLFFAEADVRIRIRRRVVSVQRKRGVNAIVSVVTSQKATNPQCSSLISTSPIAGTPIPTCSLAIGMDFFYLSSTSEYISPSIRYLIDGGALCAQVTATLSQRFDNRCRSRRTNTHSQASSQRATKAGRKRQS